MRGRWGIAAVAAAAVLAGGLVATGALGGCAAGGTAGRLADVRWPAGDRRVADDLAAESDVRLTGPLAAAGLPAAVRWALWSGVPDGEGAALPEVRDALLAGDTVVTAQEDPDGARLAAGYAAADGTARWSLRLPGRTDPELTTAPGAVLARTAREVTAIDPATGAVRWCAGVAADATVTVHPAPEGVVLAEQDGARSRIRLLDPATGAGRWEIGYEVHDAGVAPVVAGDTVTVFAVGAGGDDRRSGVRAFRTATGAPAWSSTVDFPRPEAAVGGTLLLRSDAGVTGVDPSTGRPRWTSAELDALLRISGTIVPGAPGHPALLLVDAPVTATTGGGVVGFDPGSGTVAWRRSAAELGTRPAVRLSVAGTSGGRVVLTARDRLSVLDAGTGRVLGGAEMSIADTVRYWGPAPAGNPHGMLAIAVGGPRTTVLDVGPGLSPG